ncbi:MAG: glycosyltransferase family 2 protein [Bacteroidia bacterium]
MMSPLISVIIPTFNYASFLPETIGSVMAQTYGNWECIVVDDGSTDDTKNVMDALCKSDPRIKYLVQKNDGPTIARNNGLKNASGDFIQFLDADDLLEKEKFEKQLQIFESDPSADIVYGGVNYFRSGFPDQLFDGISLEGSKPWMKKLSGQGEIMIKALLNENLMVISSPLVRRSLFEKLGKMNETLRYNEDWELWARFAIGNAKFRFDESPGTNALVRVHDSYSKDNFMMFAHGLKACLLLDEKVKGRSYKRIMIPKINYHKRILDEKLLVLLRSSREKASAEAKKIFDHTGIGRYRTYSEIFLSWPFFLCYLYAKICFLFPKLKNTIVYA